MTLALAEPVAVTRAKAKVAARSLRLIPYLGCYPYADDTAPHLFPPAADYFQHVRKNGDRHSQGAPACCNASRTGRATARRTGCGMRPVTARARRCSAQTMVQISPCMV